MAQVTTEQKVSLWEVEYSNPNNSSTTDRRIIKGSDLLQVAREAMRFVEEYLADVAPKDRDELREDYQITKVELLATED